MSTEYKRTCRRCAAVWYVSDRAAKEKLPNKRQQAAADLLAIGTLGMSGGLNAALEAQRSRVESNQSCPKCGSSKFDQEKYGLLARMAESVGDDSAGGSTGDKAKAAQKDAARRHFPAQWDSKKRSEIVGAFLASPDYVRPYPSKQKLPRGTDTDQFWLLKSALTRELKKRGVEANRERRDDMAISLAWFSTTWDPSVAVGSETQSPDEAAGARRSHGARIDESTRACPECAEPIRLEARKCKHCGSSVEPLVE